MFVAVKENIRFENRQDIQTEVMATLYAEVERESIAERTAQDSGKVGRPGRNWGDRRERWAFRASTGERMKCVISSS